jgi:hypothetical protein
MSPLKVRDKSRTYLRNNSRSKNSEQQQKQQMELRADRGAALEDSHRVELLECKREPEDWGGEEEGVDAVEDAAVAGE